MNPKLYVILSTTFMIFAGILLSSVSSPAGQTTGFSNSSIDNLSDSPCRDCHSSGVLEDHHLLVNSDNYGCPECHPVIINSDGSQTIIIIRDCMQCHRTIKITTTSDALIEINSSDALPGDNATVYYVNGTNSTEISAKIHGIKE